MADNTSNFEFRFGGIGRLYGADGLERLRNAHVCIVGIGGVGSWAVESLVRSAIGKLTLVDLDDVCESNINRQIHAVDGVIGQPKTEAMAARCRLINPECTVRVLHSFYTSKTAETILNTHYDYVFDAIDSVNHKVDLIARCRRLKIPIISSGGAGGRMDISQIKIADLTRSHNDRLLARVRKKLRQEYNFPRNEKRRFQVPCIYSPEDAVYPEACELDEEKTSHRLDCSSGYGAATHITGTFGFMAAAHIVKKIAMTKHQVDQS